MKKIFLLIGLLLLAGCGQSPTDSEVSDVVKSEESGTFEETIERLDTPILIEAWIYRNRVGDIEKLAGWMDGSGISDVDNSYSLAQAFFNKTGLVCGNFTGFTLMCARANGMECGGIRYDIHITAWIKYSNKYYYFNNGMMTKTFNTWEELQDYFKDYNYLEYWNQKLVKIQ